MSTTPDARREMREKFSDPAITADGSPRARVQFSGLQTLWVNTGTLCNIECANCYIESSPANDRLVYIRAEELSPYLADARAMGAREIGFTGGEPFMNPDMNKMLAASLSAGFAALVLTNAMRPMMRPAVRDGLRALRADYGDALRMRVSLDHYRADIHDGERGPGAFDAALEGLAWLAREGFDLSVAGRLRFGDSEAELRAGFAALFSTIDAPIDAAAPDRLVLFPEMDEGAETPEISEGCWTILGKDPRDMMCSNTRMVVKRKGAAAPGVVACTLIAYDRQFELGRTLNDATCDVSLNHPHCAKFCVLGGARCSA